MSKADGKEARKKMKKRRSKKWEKKGARDKRWRLKGGERMGKKRRKGGS